MLNINKSDKNHASFGPLNGLSSSCEIGRSAIKGQIRVESCVMAVVVQMKMAFSRQRMGDNHLILHCFVCFSQ